MPENNSQGTEKSAIKRITSLVERLECKIREKNNIREKNSSSSIKVKMAPFVVLSMKHSTSKTCPFGTLVDDKQNDIQPLIKNSKSCFISQEATESHYVMYTVIKEIITGFDPRSAEPRFSYKMIVRIADNNSPKEPLFTDETLIEKDKIKPILTELNSSKIEQDYRDLYPVICSKKEGIEQGKKFKQQLEKAKSVFNNNQFENAFELYEDTFEFMKEKSLEYRLPLEDKDKLYSGIIEAYYQAFFKDKENPRFLPNIYFKKWLENRLDMNQEVKWSFLFEKDSTKFADNVDVQEEIERYSYHLQMIGEYFQTNTDYCLKIVGYLQSTEDSAMKKMKVIVQELRKYAPKINPILEEAVSSGDNGDLEHQRVRLFVVEKCPEGHQNELTQEEAEVSQEE